MQFCVANKVLPSAEGFGLTFIFGSRLWFCLSCKRFQKNTGNPKDKCQDMLAWSCCWAAPGRVVKAFMITKLTDTTVDRYRRWCFFMPTWVIAFGSYFRLGVIMPAATGSKIRTELKLDRMFANVLTQESGRKNGRVMLLKFASCF